jgi:hypothetical protein
MPGRQLTKINGLYGFTKTHGKKNYAAQPGAAADLAFGFESLRLCASAAE